MRSRSVLSIILTYVILVFGVTLLHELMRYILKIGLAEKRSKPLAAIAVVFVVLVVTFVNYKNVDVNSSSRVDYTDFINRCTIE